MNEIFMGIIAIALCGMAIGILMIGTSFLYLIFGYKNWFSKIYEWLLTDGMDMAMESMDSMIKKFEPQTDEVTENEDE